MNLQDAALLIASRGKLMQSLPSRGGMLSVNAEIATIQPYLEQYKQDISIASENTKNQIVFSGKESELLELKDLLDADNISNKMLVVSHAFHSSQMEPILETFRQSILHIDFQPSQYPIVSNVSGKLMQDALMDADYWTNHIRSTVKFSSGLESLKQIGVSNFIEMGPHPVLTAFGMQAERNTENHVWISSLRRGKEDRKTILESVSKWYSAGGNIDWDSFYTKTPKTKLSLPTYPFQRERYWIENTSMKSL